MFFGFAIRKKLAQVQRQHAGRYRGIGRREETGFAMVDAMERIASTGEIHPVLLLQRG